MNITCSKPVGILKKINRDYLNLGVQCVLFGLGFFLMPVPFIFNIYPFALCLLASCHSNAPFVFAGALLSVYFNMGSSLPYAIALCAVFALRIIASLLYVDGAGGAGLNMERRKDMISSLFKENVGIRVAICAVCALGISTYSVVKSSFSYYEIFVLVFFVTVCSILTFALCGLYSHKSAGRSIGVSALVFSLSFLMKGISAFTLDISIILSYAIVLYASKNISPSKGAALGGLLGICQYTSFAPIFAIASLTSGFLWRFSVFLSVMCAFVLSMGYGIFTSGYEAISGLMPELLFSSLLMYPLLRFEVIPRLTFTNDGGDRVTAREILSRLSAKETYERFKGVSCSLKSISKIMCDFGKADSIITPDSAYDSCLEICEESCYSCPKRSICWERDTSTTRDNIERLSLASYYTRAVSRNDVDEKFLHRCPNIDTIVDRINESLEKNEKAPSNEKVEMCGKNYESISRILDEEAKYAEEEASEDTLLSEKLKRMADSIGFICDDIRAYGLSKKKIIATGVSVESSKCGAELLIRELSRVLMAKIEPPKFEGASPNAVMITRTVSALDVETSIHSDKTDNEEQNGDTVSAFYSSSDKFYMLICDGMGTGKVASSTSKVCAELLKSLLTSHSCKENAVEVANNFIRNKQTECSSSVDILEIDLVSGKAGLIKSGAAPTFVKRDGKVFRLFSKTAPIGIMKDPDSETLDFNLKEGDIVLMVSDGICQGEDDSGWLADMLSAASDEELSSLPRRVAERSKERTRKKDDRTVAICAVTSALKGA